MCALRSCCGRLRTTAAPPVVTAYDYTFQVALSLGTIDRQAQWRVGACGSELESSCTFVTTPVWFSTRDLHAVYISDAASTSRMLWVTGEIRSEGTRNSGPFDTVLAAYDAFPDEYGRCITDVNAESVDRYQGILLTSKGEFVHLASLPRDANGRLDASRYAIVAILKGLSSAGGEPVIAMHAGLEVWEYATVEFTVDLANYRFPAAFATRLEADPSGYLTEYDESDNVRAQCHTAYGK